jgi:type II secretory pathway component PulC
MSIITEALKKTEASIQKNSLYESSSQNKQPKKKPYLLYLLAFIAGLFLISLVFTAINRKTELPIAEPAEAAPRPAKEPETIQQLPAEEPAVLVEEQDKPEKSFLLNGIFFSENNGYALVNNQIVKESDSVDGAKVEKITENTVELNNQGEIITLSTKR